MNNQQQGGFISNLENQFLSREQGSGAINEQQQQYSLFNQGKQFISGFEQQPQQNVTGGQQQLQQPTTGGQQQGGFYGTVNSGIDNFQKQYFHHTNQQPGLLGSATSVLGGQESMTSAVGNNYVDTLQQEYLQQQPQQQTGGASNLMNMGREFFGGGQQQQ
jgi:hypothetical protein